jgi:hypothetical protein
MDDAMKRLISCASIVFVLVSSARAEIIDRILAVVGGEPVTLSDVVAANRLGLVPPPAADADRVQATLGALIERQLQLAEVNRYVPPEPPASVIDARVAAVRARFADDAAFATALNETGVTQDQLRARIRDMLRIDSYLQQRFGAVFQPGEDEIAQYYRSHESEFTQGGVLRPYREVREEARKRLVETRTGGLIQEWIEGLRRRADVTVLPFTK